MESGRFTLLQRDYIMRMIEQVAQAVARALGLVARQRFDEAQEQLDSGYGVLGMDRELLLLLDAATVARQLGDEAKVAAAARLLAGDAELQAARGEAAAARKRLRAARNLAGQVGSEDAELQAALERAERALGS